MSPISSRTPEGEPNRCPVCGKSLKIEPSCPPGDAPCPHCGSLVWFANGLLGDDFPYLSPEAVVAGLEATHKEEAIGKLVAHLVSVGLLAPSDEQGVVEAMLQREWLGSTGIGQGFAIPHCRHPSVRRVVAAAARLVKPIDFDSLDGVPVHTMILLVSPPNEHGEHMRALEKISRILRILSRSA